MLRKLIPQSRYARNVITLMTGTGLAQAIPIAISPILTRLYSPADFGNFALYMAIVSIASVLVTGRYELAVLLPKNDRDALHLVALSIGLSCVVSVVLLLVVALFNFQITQLLGAPELAGWLFWGPASTLLIGIYTSLNYWSNRKSHYQRLAISRVTQTSSGSAIQLGTGLMHSGPAGLIGGQLAGQFLASAVLARLIYREDQAKIKNLHRGRLLALGRKYRDFPRFLIVAHGFNAASMQMPVILLNTFFNAATAGFYTLTQRVLGAPVTLVSGAIGDIFRQEASQAYALTGSCKAIYIKTFKRLVFISVLPFAILFFYAPYLFGLVFGQDWYISGLYVQILTPMFFAKFVASPLSSMFMIAQRQKIDLAWQVTMLLIAVAAVYLGFLMGNSKYSLTIFSAAYCFMYIVNCVISYQLAKGAK